MIQELDDAIAALEDKTLDPRGVAIVQELIRRHREEPIRFFKPNVGAQEEFFAATKTHREIAYLGGNKAGKTCTGAKFVSQCALGQQAAKYNQGIIFDRPIDVWIGSVDYKVQRDTNQPEILKWIPKQEIKKIFWMQNGIIDRIELHNESTIGFKTYDQGRKAWQGPKKDVIWHDEEAPGDIIEESRARLIRPNAKFIFTMTPLLGFTRVYQDFVEDIKPWRKLIVGSTYENKLHLTDEYLETMEAMSEDQKRQRLHGEFVRPEGLVYPEFDRHTHVVDHFEPDKKMHVFIGGMDFGATHSTSFVLFGIDYDENVYVFKEYKEANLGMDDYVNGWKEMSKGYQVKRVFRDPSAKQAGIEFKQRGVVLYPGNNDRSVGISLIKSLLRDKRLFVSRECMKLIWELEHHRYKVEKMGGKDADVIKENDDVLDALRYALVSVGRIKPKTKKMVRLDNPVDSSDVNW